MKEVIDVKTKSGLNIFRHEPSPLNNNNKKFAKIMTKKSIKTNGSAKTSRPNRTTTLSAQVAISRTEKGMDHVQVLPDDPCEGLLKPFSGCGHAQLQSDGTFEFTRKRRIRQKPVLKLKHSSVSYSSDGYDRYVFVLPNAQRDEFAKLLKEESALAIKFIKTEGKA